MVPRFRESINLREAAYTESKEEWTQELTEVGFQKLATGMHALRIEGKLLCERKKWRGDDSHPHRWLEIKVLEAVHVGDTKRRIKGIW